MNRMIRLRRLAGQDPEYWTNEVFCLLKEQRLWRGLLVLKAIWYGQVLACGVLDLLGRTEIPGTLAGSVHSALRPVYLHPEG